MTKSSHRMDMHQILITCAQREYISFTVEKRRQHKKS